MSPSGSASAFSRTLDRVPAPASFASAIDPPPQATLDITAARALKISPNPKEPALTNERTERLAKAFLADRNRPPPPTVDLTNCFACGVRMLNKGSRFCSERCRSAYDDGFPGYDQDWLKPSQHNPMRPIATGFLIQCVGCFKEFNSKGLRSCSAECERRYNERQQNRQVMAEVGVEPKPKRNCQAPGCSATIPQWTKGRHTPTTRRFCSDKCRKRAAKALLPKT